MELLHHIIVVQDYPVELAFGCKGAKRSRAEGRGSPLGAPWRLPVESAVAEAKDRRSGPRSLRDLAKPRE